MGNISLDVDGVLKNFLTIVRDAFEGEDRRLKTKAPHGGQPHVNPLHPTANSIRLAETELAYAYIIRRSLVLGRFPCPFDFEGRYKNSAAHVDLLIKIPDENGCKCAIEIKWVNRRYFEGLHSDATKLISEMKSGKPQWRRWFILAFPMVDWDEKKEPARDPLNDDALEKINDYLRAQHPGWLARILHSTEPFKTLSGEGNEMDFVMTLFELKMDRSAIAQDSV
jgi:hypothetical protein